MTCIIPHTTCADLNSSVRTDAVRFRAQDALTGVPGPKEDAASGGFNPLRCPSFALRAASQLLNAARPAPTLRPGGQVCELPDLGRHTDSDPVPTADCTNALTLTLISGPTLGPASAMALVLIPAHPDPSLCTNSSTLFESCQPDLAPFPDLNLTLTLITCSGTCNDAPGTFSATSGGGCAPAEGHACCTGPAEQTTRGCATGFPSRTRAGCSHCRQVFKAAQAGVPVSVASLFTTPNVALKLARICCVDDLWYRSMPCPQNQSRGRGRVPLQSSTSLCVHWRARIASLVQQTDTCREEAFQERAPVQAMSAAGELRNWRSGGSQSRSTSRCRVCRRMV